MEKLPALIWEDALCIIQGGMGIGVSMALLAATVALEGGVGIISSACLDRLVSKRLGRKVSTYEAVREEISLARELSGGKGRIGINIMVAIVRDYQDSVRAAIDEKADIIISGGGLPLNLPLVSLQQTVNSPSTALVPIVSSARALEVICKKWQKQHYRPDAVVLEGPLAGGHLGFRLDELDLETNKLENLFPLVKEVAVKNGDFPVIVAGGIYSREDIDKFLRLGADGVQIGTRFLATHESSASKLYKEAYVNANPEDIAVVGTPGSPCGFPFRVIKQSPMYISAAIARRTPKCDKGYLLLNGKCPASVSCDYFCICNGLLSSANYNPDEEEPLYTCGARVGEIKKIASVRELMDELKGITAYE
jgi:nitronate monooxygenase